MMIKSSSMRLPSKLGSLNRIQVNAGKISNPLRVTHTKHLVCHAKAISSNVHRHHFQCTPRTRTVDVRTRASAQGGGDEQPTPAATLIRSLKRFFDTNFITIGLLSAITFAYLVPGPGAAAAAMNLQPLSTICIFIISGILLQKGETVAALKSGAAITYGLLSILFLTPLAALLMLKLPLHPPEIALGLAVFCCVPTTLSTGVTLTNACKGNGAVALLLTVASNMLGVFTIPLVLPILLGVGAGVTDFGSEALFKNLASTVLIPLIFGVALQAIIPGLTEWRTKNRKLLAYVSSFCLCTVPWMQLSKASSLNLLLPVDAIIAAAVASAFLHYLFLAFNFTVISFLKFSEDREQNRAIWKAVLLCTSEKTLPVAVAVINQLAVSMGPAVGIAVVPCILAHLVQIGIDSSMIGQWNKDEEEQRLAMA